MPPSLLLTWTTTKNCIAHSKIDIFLKDTRNYFKMMCRCCATIYFLALDDDYLFPKSDLIVVCLSFCLSVCRLCCLSVCLSVCRLCCLSFFLPQNCNDQRRLESTTMSMSMLMTMTSPFTEVVMIRSTKSI